MVAMSSQKSRSQIWTKFSGEKALVEIKSTIRCVFCSMCLTFSSLPTFSGAASAALASRLPAGGAVFAFWSNYPMSIRTYRYMSI